MKVIGLTGNIGSGKSAVSRFLAEFGAGWIDADKVTHEVYNPGTPGWQEIVAAFGRDVVSPEGTIDRKKLSQKVFNNPQAIAKLNQIMHPLIRREVEARLDRYRKEGKKAAVLEAILLVEAGWMDMVDELWLVVAPRDITLKRLQEQRGISEAEAMARMAAQTPAEKLAAHAKIIIHNDSSLEDLKSRVKKLWDEIAG